MHSRLVGACFYQERRISSLVGAHFYQVMRISSLLPVIAKSDPKIVHQLKICMFFSLAIQARTLHLEIAFASLFVVAYNTLDMAQPFIREKIQIERRLC